ncbi:MAG: tyrosine-type recombinase/integrase [Bacteroidetes bacterium]|nr:tyrosine-type recombinase/integrase [Bacteroidota bacterium]
MPEVSKKQPRKFKSYPGSIFKQANCSRLYIEFKGVRMSTGLPDTKVGRRMAEELLWDVYRRHKGLPTARQEQGQEEHTGILYKDAITAFERYMDATDKQEQTKKQYLKSIRSILTTNGMMSGPDIERQIEQWVKKHKEYAPTSVNIHLRNLSVFVRWAFKKKMINELPDVSQYKRKGGQKVVRIYSDDICKNLIRHFENKDDSLLRPDYKGAYKEFALLLRFLIATGARINEALKMCRSHIVDDAFVVPNKSRRNPELIPISREVRAILDKLPKNRDELFRWNNGARSALTRMLHEAFVDLEIESHGGFHVFRKTFQDRLKRGNVDMADRQKLMRHSDIKTTIDSYTYSDTTRLRNVLDGLESIT